MFGCCCTRILYHLGYSFGKIKFRLLLTVKRLPTDGGSSETAKHGDLEVTVLWSDGLAWKRDDTTNIQLCLRPRHTTDTDQIVHSVSS